MTAALTDINRALNMIPKRAEHRHAEQLRATFVDSGAAAALEAIDHQVLYGRRGTGKTHALRYLETIVKGRDDVAIYADLRTLGSPDGLFVANAGPPTERAAKLLIDLLSLVHEALIAAAIDDETLIADAAFLAKLDALAAAITTVRVSGEVELSDEGERQSGSDASNDMGVDLSGNSGIRIGSSSTETHDERRLVREVRRGREQVHLNFADVARALRDLASTITSKRLWVLMDEWSSVPPEVQPYLGEFLVRCVLPLQQFTVKIGAIEQQTNFRVGAEGGRTIGIELGADVAANVDLDEFMVFEQNEDRARSFFIGLFFKHLTSAGEHEEAVKLARESDLLREGFTDRRAFDELVRAAEGVPRDAINIAAKAALTAGPKKISVPDVRTAARAWYQTDKEAALQGRTDARRLLNWIIDEVIRGKRARGFLVNQKAAKAPLLATLFDARVLHLVRRGYSAQDEPGERYDVWVIDYGAYIDLMHTKYEPQGLLPLGTDDADDEAGYVDVPTQDLRAIRRAILDLDGYVEAGA